jgi:hypothetical protein
MASKHDWHWTFGDRCYIQFPAGGTPVDGGLGDPSFTSQEGCATIADPATGALRCGTDSVRLFNDVHAPVTVGPLGGDTASTHGAIIIPPIGGGSWYHIFAANKFLMTGQHLTYTAVTVTGSSVGVAAGPAQLLSLGPSDATEWLAAISHADCRRVWVTTQSIVGGQGKMYAILVDSDAQPGTQVISAYPFGTTEWEACAKFSPDGSLFATVAIRGGLTSTIDIMTFNRATGQFGRHSEIVTFGNQIPYGVEFSPNSKYLYFTLPTNGEVRRHTIGAPTTTPALLASTHVVSQWNLPAPPKIGALLLGPNGKIYGARPATHLLFEIGDPDNATFAPTPASVMFDQDARTVGGQTLKVSGRVAKGLPTLPRVADQCQVREDRCAEIAAYVDEILSGVESYNQMAPCRDVVDPAGGNPHEPGRGYGGEVPHGPPPCAPLDMPEIRPWTAIRWGDSKCDCIEGDDTEIMYLTVCNPYSNITLSNLVVHQLEVLDSQGNPVPNLPDGTPSIQLVPIGPYCFDDIAPCTCVTRQFILRLRGAPGGRYEIKVRGICFDACFHGDTEACFAFEVCKD